ncbi:hypothetical protein D3C87_2075740 [compost metagenome]
MEITIARMADDRGDEAMRGNVFVGRLDTIGKPGNRHTDIGGQDSQPRRQALLCPIGVVPRFPQRIALLGIGGPLEF